MLKCVYEASHDGDHAFEVPAKRRGTLFWQPWWAWKFGEGATHGINSQLRDHQFIMNYAAVFGLPMHAAPRGRPENSPTYLPASTNHKMFTLLTSRSLETWQSRATVHLYVCGLTSASQSNS